MPMLKAIETVYRGYRFRSRLEARWAVFFDSLGVTWEYEKEGYDLGPAGWYLPDFWLPDLKCWIEIKAEHTSDSGQKCAALAEATKSNVYEFFGECWLPEGQNLDGAYVDYAPSPTNCWCDQPGLSGLEFPLPPSTHTHMEGGWDNYQWWCECPNCGKVGIKFSGRNERLCECYDGDDRNHDSPRVRAAFLTARQARFEHGESPRR